MHRLQGTAIGYSRPPSHFNRGSVCPCPHRRLVFGAQGAVHGHYGARPKPRANPGINATFRQRRSWDAIPGGVLVFRVHQWRTLLTSAGASPPRTSLRQSSQQWPRRQQRSSASPRRSSTSPARARTAANHAAHDGSAATRDTLEQAGFGEAGDQNQGDANQRAFHSSAPVRVSMRERASMYRFGAGRVKFAKPAILPVRHVRWIWSRLPDVRWMDLLPFLRVAPWVIAAVDFVAVLDDLSMLKSTPTCTFTHASPRFGRAGGAGILHHRRFPSGTQSCHT